MQKLLWLGSYQTAWSMLHRYRTRGALGKTLVEIVVELDGSGGFGRVRTAIIENAQATTLLTFLTAAIEADASS